MLDRRLSRTRRGNHHGGLLVIAESYRARAYVAVLDGELVDADDIMVRPFTHALHYGSGVFEGIRAYETRRGTGVFRLHDHLKRLFVSAGVYGLNIPYEPPKRCRRRSSRVKANAFTSGYIRPLDSVKRASRLRPHLLSDPHAGRAQTAFRFASWRSRGRARDDVALAKNVVAVHAVDVRSKRALYQLDSRLPRRAAARLR